MAVVDFVKKNDTCAHKHAVRAKNRALDFGRNRARTIKVRDLCISSSSLVKCDGIPDKPLDSVGQLAVVDNDTKLQVKHASTP